MTENESKLQMAELFLLWKKAALTALKLHYDFPCDHLDLKLMQMIHEYNTGSCLFK